MRLVDADKLTEDMDMAIDDAPIYIQATVSQHIDCAPTIDPIKAAGGCYCRECRWGQEDDIGVMHCHKFRCHKKPGGYCDDGEPREARDDG